MQGRLNIEGFLQCSAINCQKTWKQIINRKQTSLAIFNAPINSLIEFLVCKREFA